MARKRKSPAERRRTTSRPTVGERADQGLGPSLPDLGDEPLIQALKRGLYAEHPLELLGTVSALVAATDEPHGLAAAEGPAVDLDELLESFLGTDVAPTTAALHVIAAFTADELRTARIGRELARRRQPMPPWLSQLDEVEVVDVVEQSHVLRDGENYYLDVRLGRHSLTAVAYVDNNLGQVVKDAFLLPASLSELRAEWMPPLPDDVTMEPVEPGQARAHLEQAIEIGAITFPPLVSDTWPMCRPLIGWLLGRLPAGAPAPEWREWSEEEHAELAEDFFSSRHGAAHRDEAARSLLSSVLWFGTTTGTGDPLRWSPTAVEVLLADWFPRKVLAGVAELSGLPSLLPDFIRYAHGHRGVSADLTVETLAAVAAWTPEYQKLIRADRPQGAATLARLMTELGSGSPRDELAEEVGGRDQLDALTVEPLPDVDFDWAGIPEDICSRTAEILALCDENADTFLDAEHRTANRRLLQTLAQTAPDHLRGRATARTTAAAICWMVAHANDSIGTDEVLTTTELLAPFGMSSASQPAKRLRELLGLPEHSPYEGPMVLGRPDLLVGRRRAELIEEREFCL